MSDYLCEELIDEIFTRLPSKSLLRFRSLSKSLWSSISSPGFIRMHTFRSPQKICFRHVMNDEERSSSFYTLHGEDELPYCLCPQRGYIGITTTLPIPSDISGTIRLCNGTFCFQTKKGFSLWNPSIRRKLNVPQCPQRSDPLLEGIGFGFDPLNDDYKIVWFSCAEGKENSYVYAMKTGAWCEIASPKPQFTRFSWVDSFSFNGVLHWKVGQSLSKPQDGSFFYIMTFDLSTHVFGMIPLPRPNYDWMTTNITTFKDSLALVSHGMKLNDTWIWIWRDDSWSVGFKLGIGKYPITGALQLQPPKNGDLLLTNYCEWILVYNPNTGVRSKVVEFSADSRLVDCCEYVETLHLLDIGETTSETTTSETTPSETTQVVKKKLQRSCFPCMQLPFWSLSSLKKSARHWFLSFIRKKPNI